MSKIMTKLKGKKKEKEGKEPEKDDDYWDEKPSRKFNFDDETDEQNASDFLVIENGPQAVKGSPKVAQSARVQSARNRGLNTTRTPIPNITPPKLQIQSNNISPDKSKEARLEVEIFNLRNKIKEMQVSAAPALNTDKILDDFMTGHGEASLEYITSREKKFQLLDQAIKRNDGNAVTRIIIWLKQSLPRDPNLMKDLISRPDAVNHYIFYLKEMKEFDELCELLTTLNRPEEAAFLEYQRKLENNRDGIIRARALRTTLDIHFRSQQELMFESNLINEQILLLETQGALVESSKKMAKSKDKVTLKLGDTLGQSLWHNCMNHATSEKENITAPNYLKQKFQISDVYYEYMYLTALSKKGDWMEIEKTVQKSNSLLTSFTGGFGSLTGAKIASKYETAIGISNLVDILGSCEMPMQHLKKYIKDIEDLEERKSAAIKWGDNLEAFECYKKSKDLAGLEKHLADLPRTDETKSVTYLMEKELRIALKEWR